MSDHAELRRLVDKLWSYCDVLRDAGVSSIDYVEQLSFLLFLKMADERAHNPLRPEQVLPPHLDISWMRLVRLDGDALENEYRRILTGLGKEPTNLGVVFRKAQNRVQEPALLRKLIVDLIGTETWSVGGDVNGDAYEALLQRSATDIKSGAGQYFTPRPLVRAMVEALQPTPDDTIVDPACGTGGFLLSAIEYIQHEHGTAMTPQQRWQLSEGRSVRGIELVDATARLATMNMYLHGVGRAESDPVIDVRDALATGPGNHRASVVLANPPFGKRSSITVVGENGKAEREDIAYSRTDFWVTTTNKQINFVQHIASLLAPGGRAAVVVPDNVLFEGGAGETVRRRLLRDFDVHTLLRLPTGIFYAGGVKANVLFFERRAASATPWTRALWVYDFRTNQRFTLKTRALKRPDLDEFVAAYRPGERRQREESESFKRWTFEELAERPGFNLDVGANVRDESLSDPASLPAPEVIAQEIVEDATAAIEAFAAVATELEARNGAEGGSEPPRDAADVLLPEADG